MAEISDLRKARGYVKARLTKLRTYMSQASSEAAVGLDSVQATVRLEKLEEVYRDFATIQKQLLEKGGDLTVNDMTEEELFEEGYFEVKAALNL